MKKGIVVFTFVSCLLLSNQIAKAKIYCLENWYIAASPSIAWHNNHQFFSHTFHEKVGFHRHYKVGYGGNASIGYLIEGRHCINFRPEMEFVYRENHLEKIRFEGERQGKKSFSKDYGSKGLNRDLALMVNLLMDIPIPGYTCWNVYVGLGLGVSRNRLEAKKLGDLSAPFPFGSNSWLAARQLIGGVSYRLADCLALTMGYRLFVTEKVRNTRYETTSKNIPYAQSIDFGFRFQM